MQTWDKAQLHYRSASADKTCNKVLTNGASKWSPAPRGVFAVKKGFFCVLPVTGALYVPAFIAMPLPYSVLLLKRTLRMTAQTQNQRCLALWHAVSSPTPKFGNSVAVRIGRVRICLDFRFRLSSLVLTYHLTLTFTPACRLFCQAKAD